jgi:hypothetical protein
MEEQFIVGKKFQPHLLQIKSHRVLGIMLTKSQPLTVHLGGGDSDVHGKARTDMLQLLPSLPDKMKNNSVVQLLNCFCGKDKGAEV